MINSLKKTLKRNFFKKKIKLINIYNFDYFKIKLLKTRIKKKNI